jgi:4'-phosphopantetheinyl transferase
MPPFRGTRDASIELGVIQVWSARLDIHQDALVQLESVLSPDELVRADRFAFAGLRVRYIASRGILRCILAQYTGLNAPALRFDYNPQGKPALAVGYGDRVSFNVSHSGDIALYAVRLDGAVGVDVEQARPLADLESIARSTFSAAEYAALMSLPAHQRVEAFFNCWTRKEAFIKAVGSGFAYPLASFDVTLRPHEPARLLRIEGGNALEWTLADLCPARGYAGAVAAPGAGLRIQLMGWWSLSEEEVHLRSEQS